MEHLHTKEGQDETCAKLRSVLGESCIVCELQLADSHHESCQQISSISLAIAEELFRSEYSEKECHMQTLSPDMARLKKASVNIDNTLSPSHTLLQVRCVDHKGLLYDILRTLKDFDIQIAHGRFSAITKGYRDLDIFIQHQDGKKIVDLEKESELCSHLRVEMLHPLRVIIASRGPDTELLVANPVELSGRGRPRVFYDVTRALKDLVSAYSRLLNSFLIVKCENCWGVIKLCKGEQEVYYMIKVEFWRSLTPDLLGLQAEIGRYSASDREWEVCRFLLDENCEHQFLTIVARNQIVDRARRLLMGW
ncbi:hypothetical protein Ancab_007261 [Ancistrocladus abbreviatus]